MNQIDSGIGYYNCRVEQVGLDIGSVVAADTAAAAFQVAAAAGQVVAADTVAVVFGICRTGNRMHMPLMM